MSKLNRIIFHGRQKGMQQGDKIIVDGEKCRVCAGEDDEELYAEPYSSYGTAVKWIMRIGLALLLVALLLLAIDVIWMFAREDMVP